MRTHEDGLRVARAIAESSLTGLRVRVLSGGHDSRAHGWSWEEVMDPSLRACLRRVPVVRWPYAVARWHLEVGPELRRVKPGVQAVLLTGYVDHILAGMSTRKTRLVSATRTKMCAGKTISPDSQSSSGTFIPTTKRTDSPLAIESSDPCSCGVNEPNNSPGSSAPIDSNATPDTARQPVFVSRKTRASVGVGVCSTAKANSGPRASTKAASAISFAFFDLASARHASSAAKNAITVPIHPIQSIRETYRASQGVA